MKRSATIAAVLFTVLFFSENVCASSMAVHPCCIIGAGFGLFGSYSMPDGDYDSAFSGGIRWSLPIEGFRPELSFSTIKFDGKDGLEDVSTDCLRLNNIHVIGIGKGPCRGRIFPVVTYGIGNYKSDESDYNGTGINFGLGLLKTLGGCDGGEIDLSANYHRIFNDGKEKDFYELRIGYGFFFDR